MPSLASIAKCVGTEPRPRRQRPLSRIVHARRRLDPHMRWLPVGAVIGSRTAKLKHKAHGRWVAVLAVKPGVGVSLNLTRSLTHRLQKSSLQNAGASTRIFCRVCDMIFT